MGNNFQNEEEMAKICDEVSRLEWINRALRQQIEFNEIRMRELSRCMDEEFLNGGGEKDG